MASNGEQTEDAPGWEVSLMAAQLTKLQSDTECGPKYLKNVCCTSLNVNGRSSGWFTAAIHASFFDSVTSPLLTDRSVSGHISG